MSFNSTTFIFFLLAVFFTHWAVLRTHWPRMMLLLVASFVFYMSWNARFVVLLLASSFLDYYLAKAIHRSKNERARGWMMFASLLGNLGLLGYFKYFNFFAENFHASLARLGLGSGETFVPWDIVLPVGISFYTFQTLSYTIDVYRRQMQPTDSLFKFLLFVAFFPQLVAGPIVRASTFLPQLDAPVRFDERAAADGLFLIAVGLIKKVVLADAIGARLVDAVFEAPETYNALEVVLGVYGALFQFYLDFSAYSDIAIGCAACLGYTLPINFDRPFLSQDLSEFWRRWHVTMTSWFRDYVFISLGGTRGRALFLFRNLMLTMLLTGLWHGAGWNYVIWGGMYGLAMFVASFRPRPSDSERASRGLALRALLRARTFNYVALSMLFFRNGTLAEGNRGLEGSGHMLAQLLHLERPLGGLDPVGVSVLAIAAAIHFTPKDWVHQRARTTWLALPAPLQAALLVLVTGALGAMAYQKTPFIYFQF